MSKIMKLVMGRQHDAMRKDMMAGWGCQFLKGEGSGNGNYCIYKTQSELSICNDDEKMLEGFFE